jgi:hypothetical protein
VFQPAVVRDIFGHIADFFGTSRGLVVERLIRVVMSGRSPGCATSWSGGWHGGSPSRWTTATTDHDRGQKRGHGRATGAGVGRWSLIIAPADHWPFISIGRSSPPGLSGRRVPGAEPARTSSPDLHSAEVFGGGRHRGGRKSGTVERMTPGSRPGICARRTPSQRTDPTVTTHRSWSRAVVESGSDMEPDLDHALAVFGTSWPISGEPNESVAGDSGVGRGTASATAWRSGPCCAPSPAPSGKSPANSPPDQIVRHEVRIPFHSAPARASARGPADVLADQRRPPLQHVSRRVEPGSSLPPRVTSTAAARRCGTRPHRVLPTFLFVDLLRRWLRERLTSTS